MKNIELAVSLILAAIGAACSGPTGPNSVCATYGNAWACYPSPCADGGV
jgi:hypothetical protein